MKYKDQSMKACLLTLLEAINFSKGFRRILVRSWSLRIFPFMLAVSICLKRLYTHLAILPSLMFMILKRIALRNGILFMIFILGVHTMRGFEFIWIKGIIIDLKKKTI